MDDFLNGVEASGEQGSPPADVMERIRRIFIKSAGLSISPDKLSYEQWLEETAILDSIAVLEFVTALEKEFGVAIEQKFLEFEFLSDLPALASYLASPRS